MTVLALHLHVPRRRTPGQIGKVIDSCTAVINRIMLIYLDAGVDLYIFRISRALPISPSPWQIRPSGIVQPANVSTLVKLLCQAYEHFPVSWIRVQPHSRSTVDEEYSLEMIFLSLDIFQFVFNIYLIDWKHLYVNHRATILFACA